MVAGLVTWAIAATIAAVCFAVSSEHQRRARWRATEGMVEANSTLLSVLRRAAITGGLRVEMTDTGYKISDAEPGASGRVVRHG